MLIKLTPGLVLADKSHPGKKVLFFSPNILKRIYRLVYFYTIGAHGLHFFFLLQNLPFSKRECPN